MIRRFPGFLFALFAATSLGGAASASPQSPDRSPRLYVFNAERTLAQTRDGKIAMETISARIKAIQATLEAKAAVVRGMRQQLDTGAGMMTEAGQTQLRTEIAKGETELRRSQEDAEMDVATLRQRVLQPLEQRLLSAVTAIAKERGADAIFQWPHESMMYVSDAVDLTSEIALKMDATTQTPVPEELK